VIETDVIGINEAVQLEFEIKDVFSMHQRWRNGQVFNTLLHPKTNHAFLYFQNGSGKYTDSKGNTFYAQKGDVVFIPFGATYKTEFLCETGETHTVLINFIFPLSFNDFLPQFYLPARKRSSISTAPFLVQNKKAWFSVRSPVGWANSILLKVHSFSLTDNLATVFIPRFFHFAFLRNTPKVISPSPLTRKEAL
jgi:hypothetical protein